jgi:hypothetical protein
MTAKVLTKSYVVMPGLEPGMQVRESMPGASGIMPG